VFAGGVGWLAFVSLGPNGSVGIDRALATGLYPFILGDVVELILASAVLPVMWTIVGRSPNMRD
jgi:biotin transporter BioY